MTKNKKRQYTGGFKELENILDKYRISHSYDKSSKSLEISRPFGVITVNVPKSNDREYYYVEFNLGIDKFFVHTGNLKQLERICTTWDEYDKWNNTKNKIKV